MTDIDKIFNEFLLSILNNGNATLVKELHLNWIEFKKQPILNDEQPEEERGFAIDDLRELRIVSQSTIQPPSGEFITKEECERRERAAFFAGGDFKIASQYSERKYWTFEEYKQSLKQ